MESKAPISHPGEWPVVSLKNICGKIGSGATPKGGQSSYLLERENYAFVRSQNVFDRYFSYDGLAYISDGQADKLKNVELKPGDILLNITGDGVTFARACMVPMHVLPACVNQHVAIIRLDEEVADPGYVLSFLTLPAVKIYIESFNAGGSRRAITKGHIESFQLPLPPIDVQRYIAQVLQSLDDKIELNRQINATLESMAQALFKSWFVDFDPVVDNALAAGNPIPEPLQARAEKRAALLAAASAADTRSASATDNAHPTQTAPHTQPGTTAPATPLQPLPADLRALFPDSFVFNEEMGWVPEGWRVESLGDVTDELRRGISPKYTEDGGVQVINQKCVRDHLVNFSLARRNDTDKKRIDGRELQIGDVLVNSTGVGTLGRVAQVIYLDETAVVDSHVTIVRSAKDRIKSYLFGQLMISCERTIEAMGEGSTGQTELSRKNLSDLKVLVPGLECQEIPDSIFHGFSEKIALNIKQSEGLAQLRDLLLPKLLSGKIQLSEAEKIAAEAL